MESTRRTKWRIAPESFRRWAEITVCLPVLTACTKPPPPDPQAIHLREKIASEEKALATYEDKVKENIPDHALKDQITEDRELLRSRLDRLKEIGKRKGYDISPGGGGEASPHH